MRTIRKSIVVSASWFIWGTTCFITVLSIPRSAFGQVDPLVIQAASCGGLPALNQSQIINRASQRNKDTIRENGGSFEIATLRSLGLNKNNEALPSPRRGLGIFSVIPDGVRALTLVEVTNGAITYYRRYTKSIFYDAKFVNGTINPSSSQNQTRGFMDHLDRESAAGRVRGVITRASRRPTPQLRYMTPTNTSIGRETLRLANRRRVAVYQHLVCDTTEVGGVIGVNDLTVGIGVLLNPNVYRARATPPAVGVGVASFGEVFTLSNPPEPDDDDGGGGGGGNPCSFAGCASFSPARRDNLIEESDFNFGKHLSVPTDALLQDKISSYLPSNAPSTSEMDVGKWKGQSWKNNIQKVITEESE